MAARMRYSLLSAVMLFSLLLYAFSNTFAALPKSLGARRAAVQAAHPFNKSPLPRESQQEHQTVTATAALALSLCVAFMAWAGQPAMSLAAEGDPTFSEFLQQFNEQREKARAEQEAREKSPFRKIEEAQMMASIIGDLNKMAGKMDEVGLDKGDVMQAVDKLASGGSSTEAPAQDAPDMSFEQFKASLQTNQ